ANIISWAHPPGSRHGYRFRPMMRPPTRLLVLSLAAALSLAACGDGGSPASAEGTPGSGAPGSSQAVAAQISGAGASFIYPLVSRWSADYNAATGHKVNYQSI